MQRPGNVSIAGPDSRFRDEKKTTHRAAYCGRAHFKPWYTPCNELVDIVSDGPPIVTGIAQAFRQLVRRPALAIAVIAMLAVGIGATTAIFSVFYQVLLEPLSVPQPDRLVELRVPGRPLGGRVGMSYPDYRAIFSYLMFRDLEAEQEVFTGIAGHHDFIANVTSGTETIGGSGTMVSGGYFQVLNVAPALGRLIGPQDEPGLGESNVVVLGYDYWQSILGGDPRVLGETLVVNNQPLTIIGVAPEGFYGAMTNWQSTVFVPLTLRQFMQPEEDRSWAEDRFNNWVYLFARLRPEVPVEQATIRMNVLYGGILRERDALQIPPFVSDAARAEFLDHRLVLEPAARGQGAPSLTVSNPLTLLLGATAFVFLIVCVNITNLLLVRGAARAGELAIRASIGASPKRLIAQLLGESAVLALFGALLAIPVAMIMLKVVAAMEAPALGNRFTAALDAHILIFAGAITSGGVLLFGLLPALRASGTDPASIIKGQSGQPSGGRRLARFRSALIGMQIALSTVLLVLAGLFALSLANVSRMDLGVDVESTLMFAVQPRGGGYEGERLDALYARIVDALKAQPGVLSVGSSAIPLLGDFGFTGRVLSVDGVELEGEEGVIQSFPWIGPGFFETMSIPLLAGREFETADSEPGAAVIVVNEAFLRRFNLERDVVGQRVDVAPAYYPGGSVQIVGIVGDARLRNVKGDLLPQLFTPRPHGDGAFSSFVFYVRSAGDPGALLAMVRPVIAGIDPNLPVSQLQTMGQRLSNGFSRDRLTAWLSAVFAGLATLLAAVGLYAVLTYIVGERTRELGLRLALGASPAGLLTLIFRQIGWIATVAVVLGLAAAFGVGQLAESLLFGLSGYDAVAFGSATVLISLVALGASYLPARRAANVAPMEALRDP
jgi:predicted permease